MSAQGKIKTLFSDKEKTEPLYPRTKMSAISNNDGIGLEAILDGAVYSDNNVIQSTVVPVNADTLGGRKASEYATNEFVIDKITEAQLSGGSGEIDLSGYVTEEELRDAVEDIDFPVGSVNGRVGEVQLTASDVGAHPNTWMPTASEVGAAPASHMNDENNPHSVTIEQIGAAPASHMNDENNPHSVTWDQTGAAPAGFLVEPGATNSPNSTYYVVVRTDGVDGNSLVQTAFVLDSYFSKLVRRKMFGTWGAWEWENPPMVLDVEYRTTERWNGKAVYTKLIDFGKLATTGTTVTIPLGCTATNLVDFNILITLSTGNQYKFPAFDFTSANALLTGYFADTKNAFVVRCHTDLSAATAVVTVKYTKD